jgi:hypothetical protein
MKFKFTLIFLLFLFFLLLPLMEAAGKVVVSGFVRDEDTGEVLIAANVAILETGSGTVTNEYGYYSLSLDPGFYTLV